MARGGSQGRLHGSGDVGRPSALRALAGSGLERGTITLFGSATALPVLADERFVGRTIPIGTGAHGVGATVAADDVIAHLDA